MDASHIFYARSKARRLAMQAAYQWQIAGQNIEEIIEQFVSEEGYDQVDDVHFRRLLQAATSKSLDKKLEECMTTQTMEEVDTIERFILRNAAYEIACIAEIDSAVAINEAVQIAKKFCGSGSYRFVNGVLDSFAKKYALSN